MKVFYIITFFTMLSSNCFSQQTLVLQPGPEEGKDALARFLSPDANYGRHEDFSANAWTNNSVFTFARCFIEFDLDSLPEYPIIQYAKLSLYSYDSPHNGTHSTLGGSNKSYLDRVVEPWDENTITYNTMPLVTEENRVTLPASTHPIQHYEDIDVTELIKDMIADPDHSFGFRFKLAIEHEYRRMVFASSDNPDTNLHPKLEISYTDATNINEYANNQINIYPNPCNGVFYIRVRANTKVDEVYIYNMKGELVKEINKPNYQDTEISLKDYSKGLYIVRIHSGDRLINKKLTVQ